MKNIRVCHVNAYETFGGSAKAAFRLHQCLNLLPRVTSTLFVSFPQHNLEGVKTLASAKYKAWMKIQPHLAPLMLKTQKSQNPVIHTLAWPPTGMGAHLISKIKQREYDIVHLHFIGNSTLSVREIGIIQRMCPVVWTLHDEWPYSGSEHYSFPYTTDTPLILTRPCAGYFGFNRPETEGGLDIDKHLWSLKRKKWKKSFSLVCPSRWIQERASNSILMKDCPSKHIPNPIDTSFWKPLDKNVSRNALSLPTDARIILFGATGGSRDPRKGWDLLKDSLIILEQILSKRSPEMISRVLLCVFGQNQPIEDLPFNVCLLGQLSDDFTLRLAYNSADVFVLPSRIDNLPTTGTEAQSCGVPVVAFSVGGLTDVVDHEKTGFLCEPFSVNSFAHSIYKALNEKRGLELATQARLNACKKWSYDAVASEHIKLYRDLVDY